MDTLAKSVRIDRKNQKLNLDTQIVMLPEEEALVSTGENYVIETSENNLFQQSAARSKKSIVDETRGDDITGVPESNE